MYIVGIRWIFVVENVSAVQLIQLLRPIAHYIAAAGQLHFVYGCFDTEPQLDKDPIKIAAIILESYIYKTDRAVTHCHCCETAIFPSLSNKAKHPIFILYV